MWLKTFAKFTFISFFRWLPNFNSFLRRGAWVGPVRAKVGLILHNRFFGQINKKFQAKGKGTFAVTVHPKFDCFKISLAALKH